ncbi:MAG: response regulator transcription factor [Deltaproteobacteria bacterium]|nr:response regulator transcription factor [Deltaproteobacteria bacterium]
MRVLIADDSDLLRTRLAGILSEIEGIEIVGEAKNATDALEFIRKLKPDVVILDVRMEGNGIYILENVKKENIVVKTIIFTNYPYLQYRKKCLDAGADYFFYKAIEFQKLIFTLKKLIPLYQKPEEPEEEC